MRVFLCTMTLLALAACEFEDLSPAAPPAERMIANNDWIGAIQYYRSALSENPGSVDLRQGYLSVAERAVDHYSTQAKRYADLNDLSAAEAQLNAGLFVVPDSQLLQNEMDRVRDMKRARAVFRDAVASERLGRRTAAIGQLENALSLDPNYTEALDLLDRLNDAMTQQQGIRPIRLRTGAPVTLNFKDAPFKDAMVALGQAYGVNIIFDAQVPNTPVTVFAENVSFVQAFELMLKSNRSFYRRLGKNSVVIALDTPDGRAEYEDYVVRTFFLQSIGAQQMGDLLTQSLGLENVSVNDDAKTVTVRDSRERIALAEQLVTVNDRALAEVVMEVEVLEINRTKSEQLGLDLGREITVTPSRTLRVRDVNSTSDISTAIGNSVVRLPEASFRYLKQDLDAKTLANPRIRTLNKREASILIGDRVPLRSSEVDDPTGQTRTTFEYQDVGVSLTVTPEVQLNNSVLVKLTLDVSSLGQNLGTESQPAFAIGTRTVTTEMMLEDTETAVIGGLIRDEERDTIRKVPGLGAIPRIGRVFQSRDGEGTRTDILLTLTPRILRGLDVPARPQTEFFSGTGNRVTTERPLDFLASQSGATLPTIRLDLAGAPSPRAGVSLPTPGPIRPASAAATSGTGLATLGFTRSSYNVDAGETVEAVITAEGFPDTFSGTAIIRYRPNLLEAVRVTSPLGLSHQIDSARGEIQLELTPDVAGGSSKEIARISLKGLKTGLSYLIFERSLGAGDDANALPEIEIRSSRVAVK